MVENDVTYGHEHAFGIRMQRYIVTVTTVWRLHDDHIRYGAVGITRITGRSVQVLIQPLVLHSRAIGFCDKDVLFLGDIDSLEGIANAPADVGRAGNLNQLVIAR